ncbi:MAG: DUF3604 domain-containing protein [Halioglobus sp.]|nr:DUF3604 domain-containing protein [Halioglobus sp.]
MITMKKSLLTIACMTTVLLGCTEPQESLSITATQRPSGNLLPVSEDILELVPAPNPDRNAYFGDLHVHTGYSFDAFVFGNTTLPADAYRYGRGEALEHPSGYRMQLQQPLDFYAVTDHAMFLGLVREAADTSTRFSQYAVAEPLHNINAWYNMSDLSLTSRARNFAGFLTNSINELLDGTIDPKVVEAVTRSAWLDTITAAREAYDPGIFTTFAAFEYTSSTDDMGNLHRNVIFHDTDRLPAVPFSRFNSQNPEGLWDWMDQLREQGIESLAIPHNSNGSNGQMFKLTDWAGDPMDDAYSSQRMRNEPLVEITQIKGTSDTHPLLSKNDEWADFEIAPYRVATKLYSEPAGSYVRDAYLRGLQLAAGGGVNPYKFGLVGASDTHNSASAPEEENYFSKVGMLDGTAQLRGSIPASFVSGTLLKWRAPDLLQQVDGKDYLAGGGFEYWSASGLTGVWAEENTREALYRAFRRKETFATSGPRMKVRFFAGYDYEPGLLDSPQLVASAYRGGVTMGGDLAGKAAQAPAFLVWATADPTGTALQRLQVIKGYLENGEHRERIYDVACSDGLAPDPASARCPDNGARVNLADCSTTAGVGAAELKALWRDPAFDSSQEAFYYVRVLQNPTCRWSTWDAIRAGVKPRSDLHSTIQERAWSSPIWYRPAPAEPVDEPVEKPAEKAGEEIIAEAVAQPETKTAQPPGE